MATSAKHIASSIRSEPDLSKPPSLILKRRTNTNLTTVDVAPTRPSWRPGQEPGLDPLKPNGGRAQEPELHEECQNHRGGFQCG